jgi:adenine-specific DNA-methyltransferase
MPVELVWEGKYDSEGRKHSPLRIALPFQTVETVNESMQERQRGLDALFSGGRNSEWRNRLIWGDKKYVLPSLLPEFVGKVNLIYIDPPFATGDDFTFQIEVEKEKFTKEPSVIEQKAYRDTWGRGLDGYLQWFYETSILLRDLLADDGSIYVHLDANVSHYAKAVLDEVFGYDNFQREIVWRIGWISGYKSVAKNWIRNHDVILFYVKSKSRFTFNKEYVPYPAGYQRRGEDDAPVEGKGYPIEDVWNANPFEFALKGEESLDSIQIKSFSSEKVGYPTQKNESLLKRIIKASSNEGDLILDCFTGSGTTATVAEKLNRRWITCDLGRFAIHTARKRLLSIPDVKPFIVQNLGKYERQAWQADEFGTNAAERVAAYTKFILDLYHAQPLSGFTWLHGVKAGRVVHVGSVDSPVTVSDVKSILIEWRKSTGKNGASNTGIDILGWEFALDMNETAKQQAAEAGVDLRFLVIPREVLEKKAVEQGDIQFLELAALFVETAVKKKQLALKLTNFIAPLEYVPQEVRESITKWESWIDYWAVDFDFKGDTFHNQWQSYRTRKNKKIETTAMHTYEESGSYTVQVKVIDILGNDTTRTINVEVA